MLYLEQVSASMPETTVSVRDLQQQAGLTDQQVQLYTRYFGLREVAVAADQQLTDMLLAAGENALRGVDRDSVRYLIHTHTLQQIGPPEMYRLEDVRSGLGLRNACAFDMTHMNCVVGLHALQVARSLLHDAAPEDKVLILAGDMTLLPQLRPIPETTIQGDGAAGCLVGRDRRGHRVIGRSLNLMGRFYQGMACPEPLQQEYKQLYVESLTTVVREAIEDARCDPQEIALILPHNVNRLSWPGISTDVGIPRGRVFLDNLPRYGHCYSADPFINLADAVAQSRVRPGDVVLMATAGLGAAFASTVIEIGEGTT